MKPLTLVAIFLSGFVMLEFLLIYLFTGGNLDFNFFANPIVVGVFVFGVFLNLLVSRFFSSWRMSLLVGVPIVFVLANLFSIHAVYLSDESFAAIGLVLVGAPVIYISALVYPFVLLKNTDGELWKNVFKIAIPSSLIILLIPIIIFLLPSIFGYR